MKCGPQYMKDEMCNAKEQYEFKNLAKMQISVVPIVEISYFLFVPVDVLVSI